MKLEINITKRKFWILSTLLALVIGVLVLAVASPPNPGHSADEVGGTVPSGFCVFTADSSKSCPSGFVEKNDFKDVTIRGKNTLAPVGVKGGKEHFATNGNAWSGGGNDGSTMKLIDVGTEDNIIFNNWPPYVGVLICCKE